MFVFRSGAVQVAGRRLGMGALRASLPVSVCLERLPATEAPAWRQHLRQYASETRNLQHEQVARDAREAMARGAAALSEGDAATAAKHLSRALELQPGSADTHYNMGLCRYMLQDVDRALVHWLKSVELDPAQSDAHVGLGNIYFMNKKEPQPAIWHMRRALELSPEDTEVKFNLACMLEGTGQLTEAIDMYKAACDGGLEKAQPYLRNAMAKAIKQTMDKKP